MESIIYTSENNNLYLYEDQNRLSLLLHPEFGKAYKKELEVDPYYLKKYAYLSDHNFFNKPEPANFFRMEESMVRDNIVNTKQIVFETTDACNLQCRYCALGELYEGNNERNSKKINTRHAINLLKYIYSLKPKSKNNKLFISFYGGEPLLNFNFIKRIVEIANQLNIEKELDIVYSMTTNGTLIHKYIDFLSANNFHLQVSLDGNEENHSYRVFNKNNKNSFLKVIENVDVIQRDYPEYFTENVNFNAVLNNKSSVKEIMEFIYTRYNKIPRIAEIHKRDLISEKESVFASMFHSKWKSENEFQKDDSDLVRITHQELSLFKELLNFLKYLSINYFVSNLNALLSIEEKHLPTSTCSPFSKKIFLTCNNQLLPCEKINYKYTMGKVNGDVEIDIPEVTRQYNFYYDNIRKFCQTCYAYRFCGACLFHINNIDNVDTEDFVCERFQDQVAFATKLRRIFSFLEKYPNDFHQIIDKIKIVD